MICFIVSELMHFTSWKYGMCVEDSSF